METTEGEMSEFQQFFRRYVGEDGNVVLPESSTARIELARAILGRKLMGSFDYWAMYAFDFMDNSEAASTYPPTSILYQKDSYFRGGLRDLSDEQRAVVKQLLLETMEGLLFSTLVALDQFPLADYELTLTLENEEQPDHALQIAPYRGMDLHDELTGWVQEFSHFARQLGE
jgi:hypothetical protein